MFHILARYRHISLFVFFMLISMVLLSLHRQANTLIKPSSAMERAMLFVLQPFQSATSYFINHVQDVWQHYIALVHLNEENQRLREEIKQLQTEKNRYVEKSLAYDRLKGTLDLVEERELSTILARVIGNDATNQANTIVVNKGSDDGVKESWPVITKDGIAGITLTVSKNSSKILLLIDPNCNVAALLQRTRDQGIVGGQAKKDVYLMKYVSRRADIRPGMIYQISDAALKELAKEGLPGFRITDRALIKLQEAGVPADLLTILEDVKDLLYVSQDSFIRALETTIGTEQTDWYKATIVENTYADLLAKLQQIKNQLYATEAEFVSALEATIGKDSTIRYQPQILKHAQEKETVVSSGLGGIFPKGLLIGTVSKVMKQDYGLFQDIEVTPSVDFSKLEEVLIIRRENTEAIP
jgi:rod shape-determining protein MreC